MFTDTSLGALLRELWSGRRSVTQHSHLFISLLLADHELRKEDTRYHHYIIDCLQSLYGDYGEWRGHEEKPSEDILSEIRSIIAGQASNAYPERTYAYLAGIANEQFQSPQDVIAEAIYRCQQRIFWVTDVTKIQSPHKNLIVGIVGFKGSGKSSVLHVLREEGASIFEVYRDFQDAMLFRPDVSRAMPDPEYWGDVPLRIGFENRGFHQAIPPVLFVGSLLRTQELEYLARFGRVLLVYISAHNQVRHERTRYRGRLIEKRASHDFLLTLDAHRSGEWIGYQMNDIGGLIDRCAYTFSNDRDDAFGEIAVAVRTLIEGEGYVYGAS